MNMTPPNVRFTNQEQAEAAYQLEIARTRYILDNVLTGINTLRAVRAEPTNGLAGHIIDFEYTYVNAVSAQMAHKTPDQMVGQRLLALFPGVVANGLFAKWVQLVETGKTLHWQEHYTEDGLDCWYETRAVRDGDGLLQSYSDITAQKRTEAELTQKAALLQTIVDTSPTGLVLYEAVRDSTGQITDFRYRLVNPENLRTTGRSAADFQAHTLLELFPEMGRQSHFYQTLLDVMQTGKPLRTDFSYEQEGISGWFDGSFIRQGDGVLFTFIDITARKRAQFDQQQAAGLLRNVMDASPAGISLMNAVRAPDGQLIDFELILTNEATAQMTGRTVADIQGKSVTETFPAYRPLGIYDHYQTVLKTRQPGRFEVHYQGDGLENWFDITASPQGDGVVGTFLDITPIRQAQQAEKQQRNLLQSVLNASLAAVAVYEVVLTDEGVISDFRFVLANQTTLNVFGLTADELYGKTLIGLNPPLRNSPAFDQYVTTYNTGKSVVMEREVRGRYYYVSVVKFGDGLLTSSIDITENRQYRNQIEAANVSLKKSNENLESFAYVASHDLQEPLRKIQSFGDLLLTEYGANLPENGQDILRRMQASAARMNGLIRDLLALSRLTTQPRVFASVDLARLVADVLVDLETVIAEKNAVIEVTTLPAVPGDALQLRQLFQNLLTNALKFSRAGESPTVRVDCEQVHATQVPAGVIMPIFRGSDVSQANFSRYYYALTVADNGIGFDAAQHGDRVFGAFQRLHGRTSHYTGTGIGLAIAKKVVENHGGGITVASREGEGATFTVYLPTL